MKLYYSKGACSLVVRIIINELQLDSEFESVDLRAKKTESGGDFFLINPKGAVPALELDNGELLTENAVILQFLADKNNATQLLPKVGDFERYRVLEWVNYLATEVHKSMGVLFNPKLSEELKSTLFIPLVRSKLKYVDSKLGQQKFLMGNEFTLPDAYLFVLLTWAGHFKIDVNEWSNLSRYFAALHQRESIYKSLQQEGLN